MSNVFVFSASGAAAQKHFDDTVKQGLPLSQVLAHLKDIGVADALRKAYPDGIAYLWAGHPGAHDELYWEMMQPGDLVLCYQKGAIVAATYLVEKAKSASLAKWAWPDAQEKPYSLVYFLSTPEYLNKPVADLGEYFGKVYQGLRRVSESEAIIRDFGSFQQFIQQGLGGKALYNPPGLGPEEENKADAGYEPDPKVRKAVENRAVEVAKTIYESRGYSTEEVGKPFDLRCKRDGEEVHVEVKGTRSTGESVNLTAGEVDHARHASCQVDLIVVAGIKIASNPDGSILAADGHVARHIEYWKPADEDLTPTEYRYVVPKNG